MTLTPHRPTAPKTSAPARIPERSPSLYELAIESQTIAGEIAIAADLLGSDDPDEQQQAIALMEGYLAEEEANRSALLAKADNICHYIDALQQKAEFRKSQAQRLKELADADARRAQRLKDNMIRILGALAPGQAKFSLPLHELRSRRSTSVEILDEALIPEDLMRTTIKVEPDKTLIKAALKAGQPIEGAQLVEKTSWSIQ